ncbi:MAG: DNA gyrase subunit A [Bacillota bacterium]
MAEYTHGKILNVGLTDEMKQSYIDYAMSVIVNRALPDVRDGLKPVHRRILYAMRSMGLAPDKPYLKSARVVGEVMGKYHPHGDQAIYDTMVRLAQDFNMRYPLVDGHGNFGSVDGDSAAAMRYTEARLTPLAMAMMKDLDKDTVDFGQNFDDSLEEPLALPARFPNLLVNGSSGIAVGMATNIPPHNLIEVCEAVMAMIDEPSISSEELMKRHLPGPDFPTGATIVGREAIRDAYTTGRGIITMRAVAQIETLPGHKSRLVITELPYQVNKAKLVEKIADLVRDKVLSGVTDLRDESDREGMRVVVELSRNGNPHVVLNQLYKHTPLQSSFGIILLALVNGHPKVMSLRDAIYYYLAHQREIIERRTRYLLEKAEDRAHILEGLLTALDEIDRVISIIRASQTVDSARERLMDTFGLSERQAQAILEMRLQRLTGLERDKVQGEYDGLVETIADYREILADRTRVDQIIRDEMDDLVEQHGDPRRTKIISGEGDLQIEDLVAEEDIVITLSHQGYIKRMPVSTYRKQRRGGKGILGMGTKEDDFVEQMFITTTHRHLLFFTSSGKVYALRAHEIPEGSRRARGTPVINLITIEPGERVTAVISVRDFEEGGYLFMSTSEGYVKKSSLEDFANIRRSGLIAISLGEEDDLIGVTHTGGETEILLVTRFGQAIRFSEEDVRPMGRTARGVIGIKLDEGDRVVGMETVEPNTDVLVVSERGFGKRTPIDEYKVQKRAGKGLKTLRVTERTGCLVGVKIVKPGNEIMLVTGQGVILRTSVDSISVLSRNTQGVIINRPGEEDKVVSLAHMVVRENGEKREEAEAISEDEESDGE